MDAWADQPLACWFFPVASEGGCILRNFFLEVNDDNRFDINN